MLGGEALPFVALKGPPRLEVADIFRAHGEAYRQAHDLSADLRKVMRDIERCRTAALGGHLDVCNSCAFSRPAFNSCRDRHCPKCQALAQARWIAARIERVLPVPHFHIVFTLPAELRALAMINRRIVFDILFQTAADTLKTFGDNPRWLGAQLGISMVLHTWTRKLQFHPHVHCVVTDGGLERARDQWRPSRGKGRFLFPVRALSKVFRAKFVAALGRARQDGLVRFTGACADLANDDAFAALRRNLFLKPWVVYAKRPFRGAEHLYEYLGRYTHRVGISNHRLVSMDADRVCFRTKGDASTVVSAPEFIRRFLLHVLPKGMVKIRHYGLYASSNVNTRLAAAHRLLSGSDPALARSDSPPQDGLDFLKTLTGVDLKRCPRCVLGIMQKYDVDWRGVRPGATIECRWERDADAGLTHLVRQDTGEVLATRALRDDPDPAPPPT